MAVDDVRQGSQGECGPACLASVLSFYGRRHGLEDMHLKRYVSATGWNMLQLKQVAAAYGLEATARSIDVPDLKALPLPAVLHWNFNHYVVLVRAGNDFVIQDPAIGRCVLKEEDVSSAFTGVAMTFAPLAVEADEAQDSPPVRRPRYGFGSVGGWVLATVGVVLALVTALLPAVLVQMRAMLSSELLIALVVGLFLSFAALRFLFAVATQRLREIESFRSSAVRRRQLIASLLNIPFHIFERRDVSELVGLVDRRLAAEDTLDRRRFEVANSALIVTAVIAALAALDWRLAVFSLFSTGIMLVFGLVNKAALATSRRQMIKESNWAKALLRENFGRRVTSGVSPLMDARTRLWESRYDNAQRLGFIYHTKLLNRRSVGELIGSADLILFMSLNIMFYAQGHYSLGLMLLGSFLNVARADHARRAISGVEEMERIVDDSKSAGSLLRLADEAPADVPRAELPDNVVITARDVSYGHDALTQPLLKALDLEIRRGERVAICGASGTGKTTLVKLLCGFYRPISGSIEIDQSIAPEDIAVVFQTPGLFGGSIRENIVGFSGASDDARLWAVLRSVQMEGPVRRTNMGLDTDISAAGHPFSAGERQRLALARALYHPRKLFILDEATAHLDADSESLALQAIIQSGATLIYVSHSMAAHPLMDRVFLLSNGTLAEAPSA